MILCEVKEGSFDGKSFRHFISNLLEVMERGSVIVMDNCRIHKDPATLEMITDM